MQTIVLKLIMGFTVGFYSLHFTGSDGKDISMSNFKGKKVLIVNTAGASRFNTQYASLEQLYQKYKDSIIIIAFPTNDFNHESNNDSTIRNSVIAKYNIHYIIASKATSLNKGNNSVYKWLTNYSQNGTLSNDVPGDFTKFLIDGSGNLIGVFAGVVDPMDKSIQDAIVN